jgi:hypothetical protein
MRRYSAPIVATPIVFAAGLALALPSAAATVAAQPRQVPAATYAITSGTLTAVITPAFLSALSAGGAQLSAIPPARLENNPMASEVVVIFPVKKTAGSNATYANLDVVNVVLQGGLTATGNGTTQQMTLPKMGVSTSTTPLLHFTLSSRGGTDFGVVYFMTKPSVIHKPAGKRLKLDLGVGTLDQDWVFRGMSQWPDQPGDGVAPTFDYAPAPMFDSAVLTLKVKKRY